MIIRETNPGLLQGNDGCVHVLIWTGVITEQNLDRSLAFARALIAKHPTGIVAVNIVAHGLQLPQGGAQRRANEVSAAIDANVLATAVVLPGEGFWVGAARAFLTGLNLVSPLKGKRTIARSIEEGFRFAASHAGRSPAWAAQIARSTEAVLTETSR